MSKRNWSFLVAILLVIVGLYYQNHQKPKISGIVYDKSVVAAEEQPIKVARVIDGDTIELINGERLRYIGMDTPEEFDARKPVQCYAKEAADENKKLVEGQTITFYKDHNSKDAYGRWLGFVYLSDGTFVNDLLVSQGYAFAYPYPPDTSKAAQFAQSEKSAFDAKLGLWSACQVYKEKSGREQTNPID